MTEHRNIQLPECRAINARLPHDDTNLTVDGLLNVDKICDADPPIREVLSVGASWIWVPRPVFKHYVGLDAIAQSSGNCRRPGSCQMKAEDERPTATLLARVGQTTEI